MSNNKRVRLGVSGPRASTYETGIGIKGSGSTYSASYGGHELEVKKAAFDVGGSITPRSVSASFSLDLLGASYKSPRGFGGSYSLGIGGSFSAMDDPVAKRTQFEINPFGKGKSGFSFSASHDQMDAFSKHIKTTSDPNW